MVNHNNMQGITPSSIKRNPALIPLYVCVGAGALMSVLYTLRLATRNPDITWTRKTNPEPNDEYRDKQYKFMSPTMDYSKLGNVAPKFQD